jgi:hypothetical protein
MKLFRDPIVIFLVFLNIVGLLIPVSVKLSYPILLTIFGYVFLATIIYLIIKLIVSNSDKNIIKPKLNLPELQGIRLVSIVPTKVKHSYDTGIDLHTGRYTTGSYETRAWDIILSNTGSRTANVYLDFIVVDGNGLTHSKYQLGFYDLDSGEKMVKRFSTHEDNKRIILKRLVVNGSSIELNYPLGKSRPTQINQDLIAKVVVALVCLYVLYKLFNLLD